MNYLESNYVPDQELNDPIARGIEHHEKEEDCPFCDGEGVMRGSSCCGAAPTSNGDCSTKDIGICPECRDHCDYDLPCEDCHGTGKKQ